MSTPSRILLALAAAATPAAAQDFNVVVPASLSSDIKLALPEYSSAGAAFLSTVYTPNLVVSEPTTISVIFLWEGASYQSTLGYFTYSIDGAGAVTILSSNLVIPNASFPPHANLTVGAGYDLRDAGGSVRVFQAGENVGFFLIADGWRREPQVQAWVPGVTAIPTTDPEENEEFGRGCYTSLGELNPESEHGYSDESGHLAMMWFAPIPGFLGDDPFLVAGFEDRDRSENSDHDFNDIVFAVHASPIAGIAATSVLTFLPGDPDGDQIFGTSDHYPSDASRAFIARTPANGEEVLALEDLYPSPGDQDFNDAAIAFHFETVTSASGGVMDVLGTFHLFARGAGLDHQFGLHVPGLPDTATGSVQIERFYSDDAQTHVVGAAYPLATMIQTDQRRVPDIVPSTWQCLPPTTGHVFTNTDASTPERNAASFRVLISLDAVLPASVLGTAPFDPYFSVVHGAELWDIHLPGFDGFADRPATLPVETGPTSFLDDLGNPWLMRVPTTWRFPLERVLIDDAYDKHSQWVTSKGKQHKDWYKHPSSDPEVLSSPLSGFLLSRIWTVGLPQP